MVEECGGLTVTGGDMQDGMLAHYLEQAKSSDVNVEARLDKEPFDWRMLPNGSLYLETNSGLIPFVTTDK